MDIVDRIHDIKMGLLSAFDTESAKPFCKHLDSIVEETESLRTQLQQSEERVAELEDAIESACIYGRDTLSGPAVKVESLSSWCRDGIAVMLQRLLATHVENDDE